MCSYYSDWKMMDEYCDRIKKFQEDLGSFRKIPFLYYTISQTKGVPLRELCWLYRMSIYLPFICLVIASVYGFPEPAATPSSGYTHQNGALRSTSRGFRPTTVANREDEYIYDDEIDNEPESSQDRAPTYANQNYPLPSKSTLQPNYPIPVRTTSSKVYPTHPPKFEKRPYDQQQQQYVRRGELIQDVNQLEEEKEIEEPDRLSLLLPQSKFHCNGKKTGYYADVDLDCEVFHYCQENTKHSWICPEGFSFHQVHLICMPPGGENVCEKSTDYHFVNEYLYKPLNLEEHQRTPNISLVYSDRYYPEQYRSRYDDEEEDERPVHHQHSIRVTGQPRPQYASATSSRPQLSQGQVFRSPEEINISLQQRRPPAQHYVTEY